MPLTDHEKTLFALARQYVTSGRLPHVLPKSVLAGRGCAGTCSLCGQIVEPAHIEYELTGSGGETYHLHIRCHAIWQLAASAGTRGDHAPL